MFAVALALFGTALIPSKAITAKISNQPTVDELREQLLEIWHDSKQAYRDNNYLSPPIDHRELSREHRKFVRLYYANPDGSYEIVVMKPVYWGVLDDSS